MIWLKRVLAVTLSSLLVGVATYLMIGQELGFYIGVGALLLVSGIWHLIAAPLGVRLLGAQPLEQIIGPKTLEVMGQYAQLAGLPKSPCFYYLDSPMANAYALGRPGQGAVVLTTGLLEGLHEAELVAVLGHEYHHIRSGDGFFIIFSLATRLVLRLLIAVGIVLAFLFGLGLQLAASLVGVLTNHRGGFAGLLVDSVQKVGLWAQQANEFVAAMVSRESELLADLGGARLVAAVFDLPPSVGAEYMGSALQRMEQVNSGQGIRGVQGWFNTHPATSVRLKHLERLNKSA